MYQVQVETGSSAEADNVAPISDATFGVRYISYHSIDRFIHQIADLDVGLIVWPGGSLAENREDRYGFEYDDLYNSDTNKPGLSQMLALAVEKDCDFSMVVPTIRYVDDLDLFRAEVSSFVEDLATGEFGDLPDRVILEIGVEYYANMPGAGSAAKAALYAEIAEAAVVEIATTLASLPARSAADRIEIAVQSGKTLADDDIIRSGLSDVAMENIDMVIHHHFPYRVEGVDARADRVEDIMAEWRTDALEIGAETPELFMSAWNVATITRAGVLDKFLSQDTTGLAESDIDLEGRTNAKFEKFWQNELSKLDFGTDHAGLILEMYHDYLLAGASAGAVYGVDSVQAGSLSVRDLDGVDHNLVGIEMFEMLSESVRDCVPLAQTAGVEDLRLYGFESEDKLVLYLVADDLGPGGISIDIEGLQDDYLSVSADSLHGVTSENWMESFGVPDNLFVDETPEAMTYSEAVVQDVHVGFDNGSLTVSTTHPDQIIRLAFAKTSLGKEDIESWSEGTSQSIPSSQTLDEFSLDDLPSIDIQPVEESSSGGEMGLLLLLLGLFL